MNKLVTALLTIGLALLLSTPGARAQSLNKPGTTNPVEFYTCHWVEGKGMPDLLRVTAKFREWARKYNSDYAAWILTPNYHSPTMDYDVVWLGSWPDFRTFAGSQANWWKNGRELAAEFSSVIDCSEQHQLVTSILIDAPEGPPASGVALLSRCSLAPGKTIQDALDAHVKAGKVMKKLGSKQRSWMYTPGLGAAHMGFDYWRLIVFSNYLELGDMLQIYTAGGGKQQTDPYYEGVATCDAPAVFDAQWAKKGTWYKGPGED